MGDKSKSFHGAEEWKCGGCNDGQREDNGVRKSGGALSRWTKGGAHLILLEAPISGTRAG